MLPDKVFNPGPPTYESGALPIALRGPARPVIAGAFTTLLDGRMCYCWNGDWEAWRPDLAGAIPSPRRLFFRRVFFDWTTRFVVFSGGAQEGLGGPS